MDKARADCLPGFMIRYSNWAKAEPIEYASFIVGRNMRSIKLKASCIVLFACLTLLAAGCGGENPEKLLNSAKDYLAKNEKKSAIIQIKNALQSNPDLAEARFLLGVSLLDMGDPAGAETELRKALALNYSKDFAVPQLAKAQLAQGQARKLTDEFAKFELSDPAAQASLKMSLNAAYTIQGKQKLSQDAMEGALAALPGFEPALIEQARQKAGQRDFDGALTIADELIAKFPSSYDAFKLRGDVLLYGKKQDDQALESYRKAIQIKSDYLPAHVAIAATLLQQGKLADAESHIQALRKIAPNTAQTKYFEAQLAYQKQNFGLAKELLELVLKTTPSNAKALQLAGATELALNSLVKAEAHLGKAVQIAPGMELARRLLVMTYLWSGQPTKALTALLPGLDRQDIDPELLTVAGEVYLQNGDVKRAEEYFAKAAKQNPKDARKRTNLAMTQMMGGQVDAAFVELQNIVVSDPGITADMALISALLNRQELDKALKAIDRLEKKQPAKPLAANLRGRALRAKNDVIGARRSFERALSIDPSFFPAAASLAEMDIADKKPDDAKKRFEALLSKNPKNSQALVALAELAEKSGASKEVVARLVDNAVIANPTEIAPRVLQIGLHMRNNDLKAASSAAQNAAAALPDNPEVNDILGRTQLAAGEFNQAIATYTKLAALQPLSTQPLLRLAGAYIAAANTDAARSSLRKSLEIKPDLLEGQKALVFIDVDGKKFQDALAIARTVQKQRPNEAVGYELEGGIHTSQKNWDSALAIYRGGLKKVSSPELAIKLHALLLASGKSVEADKFAVAWKKEQPKDAAFLFYLGDDAASRKDAASAEKYFTEVIKLKPNNAVVYNNLAFATANSNREAAIGYAERANALAPNQPEFMDTLSMLLSDKGDYTKAIELQNKALTLQPANTTFKLNLAKIYIKADKKVLARKELDELGKLGEKFTKQAEVTSLLKSL